MGLNKSLYASLLLRRASLNRDSGMRRVKCPHIPGHITGDSAEIITVWQWKRRPWSRHYMSSYHNRSYIEAMWMTGMEHLYGPCESAVVHQSTW